MIDWAQPANQGVQVTNLVMIPALIVFEELQTHRNQQLCSELCYHAEEIDPKKNTRINAELLLMQKNIRRL